MSYKFPPLAAGLKTEQVWLQIGILTAERISGISSNQRQHRLEDLRVSRVGWNNKCIPASKFSPRTMRDADTNCITNNDDWYIYSVADKQLVERDENIQPSGRSICIKSLLKTQDVAAALDLAIKERRISLRDIDVRRAGWEVNTASIPGCDFYAGSFADNDDWELWVADPGLSVGNRVYQEVMEPQSSQTYCIRSQMHISDINKTLQARDGANDLLADYWIRRDEWQSNQPSIAGDQWDIGKLWQDRTLSVVDLDANDWAVYAVPLFADTENPVTITNAMACIRTAMQADESWAWLWHCNLAMLAMDAGADRLLANKQAATFMSNTFDVDMRTNQLYRNVITRLEVERDKQCIQANATSRPAKANLLGQSVYYCLQRQFDELVK